MLGDKSALDDKNAFNQSCHARTSFKVADICLYRTNDEGILGSAVLAEQLRRSLCLLYIADLGAGSVALHVRRPGDIKSRIAIDVTHVLDLAGLARKGDTYRWNQ